MQTLSSTKDVITQYWDDSATTYDKSFGHGLRSAHEKTLWLDLLRKNVCFDKGAKILDVGSGTGFLSLLLAELGFNVTGMDLSAKMRDEASKKADKAGLDITFVAGDAENPPFEPGSFDAIISRHVVWTLPSPQKTLANWQRLTSPGGAVLIIDGVWTPRSMKGRMRYFLAGILRLLCGSTDHLFWKNKYAPKTELPFFGGAEPEILIETMKNEGFEEIWHDPLEDILHHERFNSPLDYSITHCKNRRYLIGGKS